ncbi:membrane dipeptidase, partial [bacterium]
TWNNSNKWATSCMDKTAQDKGLTPEGVEALAEINRLGGIIDLSHSGEKTFWDIMEQSEAAPICTHSCCRAIKDSPRNLTDEQIKSLIERGGVIGINFYTGFLSTKSHGEVVVADLVNHIEHIFELGGEKNAALGSDFDGVSHLPREMTDCTGIVAITEEMLRRGFEREVVIGVLGRNFLRIFKEICG